MPFEHFRFDSRIKRFYAHFYYLPYGGQNGTQPSNSNGKDNEFEYKFLIICKYLNFGINQYILL